MDLLFPLDRIFLRILCMSLSGACVIGFVLLARLALRRAPKRYTLILWTAALARLLVPLSIESPFTLLPVFAKPVSMEIYAQAHPTIHTGIAALNTAVSASLPAATPYASMNPIQFDVLMTMLLWLLGVIVGLSYLLASGLHLRGRLRRAVLLKDNIYLVAGLETPFVSGVFRPRIYLPEGLSETETACIVSHEQIHIRRRDPLWKLLGFLALCLHWFNPLVWVAFFLSARDLEMACDEAAAQGERQEYCTCLLRLATGKRGAGLTPTAFCEGDVTPRIKRVLSYKKPPRWARLAILLAALVCGAALLTNPVSAVRMQNKIARLSYGQETHAVREDELGYDAIMNVMVKSAAWPSETAIETLPVCYRIRQTLREGWHTQTHDYYAYLLPDGRAVLQYGADGWYSILAPELYTQMASLFGEA